MKCKEGCWLSLGSAIGSKEAGRGRLLRGKRHLSKMPPTSAAGLVQQATIDNSPVRLHLVWFELVLIGLISSQSVGWQLLGRLLAGSLASGWFRAGRSAASEREAVQRFLPREFTLVSSCALVCQLVGIVGWGVALLCGSKMQQQSLQWCKVQRDLPANSIRSKLKLSQQRITTAAIRLIESGCGFVFGCRTTFDACKLAAGTREKRFRANSISNSL